MKSVEPGDCVRNDIPTRDNPDFQYRGERREVIEILRDDAGASTGDEQDSYLYRVRLASGIRRIWGGVTCDQSSNRTLCLRRNREM
jgi:hypothetical protein